MNLRWRFGSAVGLGAWVAAGILAVMATGLIGQESSEEASAPPIKVLSFNIRYGAADDGENSWRYRHALVLQTIQVTDPDLLGMQEVLGFQAEYLRARLPGYAFHGVGRDDGNDQGEYSPVMYRQERFEQVDAGHFWLSEEPDVPGSKSWDSSLPRMVSWVLLADRRAGGREFIFANTHWDHRGREARLESGRLIRRRIDEVQSRDIPVILSGDFNTTEERAPYAALVLDREADSDTPQPLVDTYRAIHPTRSENEATFSRWNGHREGGRIDWIVHTRDFVTLNAWIDYTQDQGRFPSDHYPVGAVVRWAAKP